MSAPPELRYPQYLEQAATSNNPGVIVPVVEQKSIEQALSEQSVFVQWLIQSLTRIKGEIPNTSFYCKTEEARFHVDQLLNALATRNTSINIWDSNQSHELQQQYYQQVQPELQQQMEELRSIRQQVQSMYPQLPQSQYPTI
jgi:septal ring factor EnvC (AmiA/AmiB activator)